MEENTLGSMSRATRQTFKVEMAAPAAPPQVRYVDVRHDRGRSRMSVDDDERPVTPRLARAFQAVSDTRIALTPFDLQEYRSLHRLHSPLLTDLRVSHLPASAHTWFDQVEDVDDGEFKAIVVPPGSERGVGTIGVLDCIACAAIAPSRRQPEHTVLALTHYTGGTEEGELLDPQECLERLIQVAAQAGADESRLEIMLAGGEHAHSGNQAHRVDEHLTFLELSDSFPIVAARMPTTRVDTNSDMDSIGRLTDDDMNQGINVVLTQRGFVYSHAPLYRRNAES